MAALVSIVLAGAAVVPAMPLEANTWFTSKDHPKTALAVAQRGNIPYAIDVAPDGTALRCTTPGDADLDRKVCELLMKSARFTPASDDQGRSAFAVHEGAASFLLPGKAGGRPDRAKLAVTVDSLPAGAVSPAYARVAFSVDSAGMIGNCVPLAGGERRRQQTVPALGPAACARVASDYRPPIARDAAGHAVASVQTVTIRFETRPAS
jgi:hypothetical protein